MDGKQFDDLLRVAAGSRRSALGGIMVATAALLAGTHAGAKRKKRKKCKSGAKRCGKTCIAATGCCVDTDCPNPGEVCRDDHTCVCTM